PRPVRASPRGRRCVPAGSLLTRSSFLFPVVFLLAAAVAGLRGGLAGGGGVTARDGRGSLERGGDGCRLPALRRPPVGAVSKPGADGGRAGPSGYLVQRGAARAGAGGGAGLGGGVRDQAELYGGHGDEEQDGEEAQVFERGLAAVTGAVF